jgi:predicted MFS family arabinose efflux permease
MISPQIAAGAPLGSIFGNLLSGVIAEYANWKWVFGAMAIMAAAISVAGVFLIPPPPPSARLDKAASVDWIGAVSITSGLIALMFALTEGNVVGWSVPWVPVLIVVSILIIAAFAVWQLHLEKKAIRPPLIRVSMFRNLRFSAVMLTMAFFFASFNNYLVFATYFYQGYQGLSPLQTMLRFIPTGVSGCIIAVIVAQLLSRVPTFYFIICGTLAASVSSLLFSVPIPPSTSYFAWGLPAMVLSVVGADTIWPCLTLFTSQALRPEDQAIGGALINAMGQFGRAIGLAISTAIQTAVMADERGISVEDVGSIVVGEYATLKGIRAASWMNFGFGMGALLVVLLALRSKEIIGKPKDTPPRVSPRIDIEQAGEVARDIKA